MKQHYAYSFLELLIILSLLTITAMITFVSLKNFWDSSTEKLFRGQLLRAIETARSEAITRGQSIGLCASENQQSCIGAWEQGQIIFIEDKNSQSKNILATFHTDMLRGHLYTRFFPAYHDYLSFSPSGPSLSDNGTFWYCQQKALQPTWAIVLNKGGQARIIEPDKNNIILDSRGNPLQC
jgi:Tfp pilus assembly protein FimT